MLLSVGISLVVILLGVVMLLNVERIDTWQEGPFPRRPKTPTRWQGAALIVGGMLVLIGGVINVIRR
jgi:hypothetical protein